MNWIYYFISFYVFFNIAVIPVAVIVLRTNIMKLLQPDKLPKKSNEINRFTLLYTGLVLTITIVVALVFEESIEYVLMFTTGLCGMPLLLIYPAISVYEVRKRA